MIRDWWQRNGKPLITGSALALILVFGWKAWQNYQVNQAQTASMLYQQLLDSVLANNGQVDAAQVAAIAGNLQKDFAGSAYAQYGRLFVAKAAVESGKLDDAALELQAVLDKPVDATLEELARQRLARVQAAQGKADAALKLLEGNVDPAFQASREELKGDLLLQLGRTDEARAAYEKAKVALSDEAAVSGVQMKLDDLATKDE
ncbi:tetratricopeptide repeat protein [Pseudomonas sp. N040]|uniref:tetratricopeptide repeat protein n=1 Tax=Pseudomonas sp. N040 TaxID=2785325 RepID=UPI001E5BB46E|nr:tetratricopeptide repeat protein [Pseudomonas sp. N040]